MLVLGVEAMERHWRILVLMPNFSVKEKDETRLLNCVQGTRRMPSFPALLESEGFLFSDPELVSQP